MEAFVQLFLLKLMCVSLTETAIVVCNWQCYLDRYPRIKKAFGSDFASAAKHYQQYGKKEGRKCYCPSSAQNTSASQDHHTRSPWVSQYSYTSPELFYNTITMRSTCTWSAPAPLQEFLKQEARNNAYSFLHEATTEAPKWVGEFGKNENCNSPYLRKETWVSTCRVRRGEAAVEEITLTRVGLGPSLLPITIKNKDFHCLTLLAAMPTDRNRTSYLVESGDVYVRPNGGPIPYPPLHPHHSNFFLVGFNKGTTPYTSSSFDKFFELPIYTVEDFQKAADFPASMNTLGYNVDKLGCNYPSDSAECFFTKLPSGFGLPLYPHTDAWVDAMLNMDSPVAGLAEEKYILEFYRKWVTPIDMSSIQPLWSLDFSIVGNGFTYRVLPKSGPGVMWRTWRIPFNGTFKSSWYHTHPMVTSEMMILIANSISYLPDQMKNFCDRPSTNKAYCDFRSAHPKGAPDVAVTGNGVFAPVPYDVLGTSQKRLQLTLMQHKKQLSCYFRSQQHSLDGHVFGSGGLIHEDFRERCDNFNFEAGAAITMVVFVAESDLTDPYEQHHRWWPLATLDLPVNLSSI